MSSGFRLQGVWYPSFSYRGKAWGTTSLQLRTVRTARRWNIVKSYWVNGMSMECQWVLSLGCHSMPQLSEAVAWEKAVAAGSSMPNAVKFEFGFPLEIDNRSHPNLEQNQKGSEGPLSRIIKWIQFAFNVLKESERLMIYILHFTIHIHCTQVDGPV